MYAGNRTGTAGSSTRTVMVNRITTLMMMEEPTLPSSSRDPELKPSQVSKTLENQTLWPLLSKSVMYFLVRFHHNMQPLYCVGMILLQNLAVNQMLHDKSKHRPSSLEDWNWEKRAILFSGISLT